MRSATMASSAARALIQSGYRIGIEANDAYRLQSLRPRPRAVGQQASPSCVCDRVRVIALVAQGYVRLGIDRRRRLGC